MYGYKCTYMLYVMYVFEISLFIYGLTKLTFTIKLYKQMYFVWCEEPTT